MRERITPITAYCIRLQRMMYQSQPIAADSIFSRRITAHCISNAIRCDSLQHVAIEYLSFGAGQVRYMYCSPCPPGVRGSFSSIRMLNVEEKTVARESAARSGIKAF